jgi:predicted ArsR family transcriptional regulator
MTTQIDLFDLTYRSRMLARNQDPQTSHKAAKQVSVFANNHHRKIYQALQTIKDGTFYEIAERSGLEPSSVWRRLNELERDGLIQPTGEERRGPTGRMCRVWRAK